MPETSPPAQSRWRRFTAALPMRTALTGVGAVWLLGCVWSFEEQTNFAAAKGFSLPWLLPLVIDGLAAAMAGVAYAASLDARPAIPARLATALAVGASAASNGAWAWERSNADPGTVVLAVSIPLAANLAFEVLLSELRRQVQRRRGQQPPVAVPYPRVIRMALAPRSTFVMWRRLVLELTDLRRVAPPVPIEPRLPAPSGVANGRVAIVPAVVHTEPVRRPSPVHRPSRGASDERVQRIAELLGGGEELTGDSVGELFGCSPRTGRRLLAQGAAALGSNGSAD